MSKKKRRVVVVLFADRRIVYWTKVRVLAPSKARDRDILEMFYGDTLPPFLNWQLWNDEDLFLCSDRNPAICWQFGDEEPDIVLERGKHGYVIAD